MKHLDILVVVSVFQEMLGVFLWIGLGAAALVLLGVAWMLVRERGLRTSRLAWSELVGLAGGVVAILVMQAVTHSSFADIGGPIDWVLVALIWLVGFIFAMLAAYLLLGLVGAGRARPRLAAASALPRERQRTA